MALPVTKTIKLGLNKENHTFTFDETGMRWYLVNSSGKYLRVATETEHEKLRGIPTIVTTRMVNKSLKDVKNNEAAEQDEVDHSHMSYQRAYRIRNIGLGSLIARRIANKDGIGASIKSSISDKLKSKFIGIKSSLDPLNIAKNLTGELGASLLGALTNRTKEDMHYFVKGRSLEYSKAVKKKDPLHTKVSDKQNVNLKKGDALADVMAKLYNLTKRYHDEDIERLELSNDFKKESDEKKEKRNAELLSAITGKPIKRKTATVEKDDDSNIFSDIMSFKGILELLGKAKWLLEALAEGTIGGFLTAIAIPLTAIVGAYLIKSKFNELTEDNAQAMGGTEAKKAMKEIHDNSTPVSPEAQSSPEEQSNVQDQIKREIRVSSAVKEKQDKKANFLLGKGYNRYRNVYMGGLIKGGYVFENKEKQSPPKELLDEADSMAESALVPAPIKDTSNIQIKEVPKKEMLHTSPTNSPKKEIPNSISMATPVPPTPNPIGQRVQDAIEQNNDMKVDVVKQGKSIIIDKSKVINAGSGSSDIGVAYGESATVRNDETSMQKVQRQSLRQV